MNLIVIGANSTGKTHYAGQLYGRLREGESRLKLRHPPQNLAPLENVLNRLSDGKTALHTERDVYHEIEFPLVVENGAEFSLLFPDYGGEQIKNIIKSRSVPNEWIKRLTESDGWMVFIRPSLVTKTEDLITRPPGKSLNTERQPTSAANLETEKEKITSMTFVELLQAGLAVSRRGILRKRKEPVLLVVLSCWDELAGTEIGEKIIPHDVLRRKLPMFAEFLAANWESDSLRVYGLSSLGKSLDEKNSDDEYLDFGPENFGYVVTPEGEREKDLTLPIVNLLGLIRNED